MAENSHTSPPTAAPPSDADASLHAAPAERPGAPPAMFRKLVLWAGGAAAALAVIVAAILGVQFINNERSIHKIERLAERPVVPAPLPVALPPPENTVVAVAPPVEPAAQSSALPAAGTPEPAVPDVVPVSPAKAEPVKASARKASGAKRAKKKSRAQDDTFKRCPPLGKPGAVMCRWHICNGGAGKERACRPYLERAP